MFPTRFFSNNSLASGQNSLSSIDSSCSQNNNFGTTTKMELYPRRRHTEFYSEPQPMIEYQSRVSEHPQDKLQKERTSKCTLESIPENTPLRINPPRNSDMRLFRNSYFS